MQETGSALPGWTSARWGRMLALPHSSVTIRCVGITVSVEINHTRPEGIQATEATRSIVQMLTNALEIRIIADLDSGVKTLGAATTAMILMNALKIHTIVRGRRIAAILRAVIIVTLE